MSAILIRNQNCIPEFLIEKSLEYPLHDRINFVLVGGSGILSSDRQHKANGKAKDGAFHGLSSVS